MKVKPLNKRNGDGKPYVVPVCFVFDVGRIYFHCALEGKKLDNIRANPSVCFSVYEVLGMGVGADRPCNSWAYFRSVMASGTARILEGDEKLRPLRLLAEKFAGGPVAEMPADSVGRTCVVEITIDEVSGKKNEKKINS
jgi:nitroimidazol reductase NimA-like FMN-containing flavoprotein (pyridoxamine 5'-phosphate oxidase superfamily)